MLINQRLMLSGNLQLSQMFRYLIPKSKTKATAESVLISVNKSHRCGGKKAFNRLFAFSFRQNLQNNLICCINSNIYRPKVEKVDWMSSRGVLVAARKPAQGKILPFYQPSRVSCFRIFPRPNKTQFEKMSFIKIYELSLLMKLKNI